jgi:hypothetical protein
MAELAIFLFDDRTDIREYFNKASKSRDAISRLIDDSMTQIRLQIEKNKFKLIG